MAARKPATRTRQAQPKNSLAVVITFAATASGDGWSRSALLGA